MWFFNRKKWRLSCYEMWIMQISILLVLLIIGKRTFRYYVYLQHPFQSYPNILFISKYFKYSKFILRIYYNSRVLVNVTIKISSESCNYHLTYNLHIFNILMEKNLLTRMSIIWNTNMDFKLLYRIRMELYLINNNVWGNCTIYLL